jgi:deoxycytidylate deaminase
LKQHLPKLIELSVALRPRQFDFHHCSFIFDKSKIVSIGVNNTNKTHPRNLNFKYVGREGNKISSTIGIHSEMSCVIKLPRSYDFRRLKIVNVRIRKDGTLGMSKPCRGCTHLIQQLGFKEAWYTDHSGNLVRDF